MCGINLTFGKGHIHVMNKLIGHRGTRDNYLELSEGLFLGHVRLPIQGLSEEYDHPITEEFLIGAFVGEIYNYNDLDPTSHSDLRTMLKTLLNHHWDGFKKFDGMWSAIIYNEITKEVHIFTDHLAKKPLYMRWEPFAVSSEIKALTHLGENTFDQVYFSSVGKWGYCPEERTPFNEITKIPHGMHIVYDTKTKSIKGMENYIDLKPTSNLMLREILSQAVKNRMVSDVPVALLMSGGLDSAIIYYLMREFTKEITIFHVDNDEAQYLEYIDFRPTDKLVKIDLDPNYDLDEILEINEGPVDLGSLIPQTLLAKKIKEHGFNVCISGDGADELFGGYKRSTEYDSQYSDIYHELIYYHLPRLDKVMMSQTIELRCPFLAPEVISRALGMSYQSRIHKNGLKGHFGDLIPKEILDRKKMPLRHRTEKLNRHKLIEDFKNLMRRRRIV